MIINGFSFELQQFDTKTIEFRGMFPIRIIFRHAPGDREELLCRIQYDKRNSLNCGKWSALLNSDQITADRERTTKEAGNAEKQEDGAR